MTGLITPAARAARKVAVAALESPASAYGAVDAIVFALDAAGLLQSPETTDEPIPYRLTPEIERLRGKAAGHVRHAGALLRELRDAELDNGQRALLALALDLADDHVAVHPDGFTDADRAALTALRRLTRAEPECAEDGAR